jgi:hypothetical protein
MKYGHRGQRYEVELKAYVYFWGNHFRNVLSSE